MLAQDNRVGPTREANQSPTLPAIRCKYYKQTPSLEQHERHIKHTAFRNVPPKAYSRRRYYSSLYSRKDILYNRALLYSCNLCVYRTGRRAGGLRTAHDYYRTASVCRLTSRMNAHEKSKTENGKMVYPMIVSCPSEQVSQPPSSCGEKRKRAGVCKQHSLHRDKRCCLVIIGWTRGGGAGFAHRQLSAGARNTAVQVELGTLRVGSRAPPTLVHKRGESRFTVCQN